MQRKGRKRGPAGEADGRENKKRERESESNRGRMMKH